jgi:hypothetical protein
MLTVNVRMGETERVFSAKHVIASHKDERSENFVKVRCYDERNDAITVEGKDDIESGVVFVMNEAGKTVATYWLPPAPPQ